MASVSTEKMRTKKVKGWYEHLLEPKQDDSGKNYYDCMLLIPKTDTDVVAKARKLIDGLAKQVFGTAAGKVRKPLKDGCDFTNGKGEHPEEMDDYWYMNAKSQYKPDVIDVYKQKLETAEDVYSGMICLACINFYSYNEKTNKGVSCGLSSLVKVGAGERIVGQGSAESDFEGEDLSSYAEEPEDGEEDY